MAASLASLFLAYRRELLAFLSRRLRDRQLAADMVQDVYLRLAERGDARDYANGRAYLFRIATNLAIDHERRRTRLASVYASDAEAEAIADDKPDSERLLDARDRLDRVRAALAELPELTQQIVRLVRIEGHSYAQTARLLRISESSVQKHLAAGVRHAAHAISPLRGEAITRSRAENVIPLKDHDGTARK
ncbi:hypothetical protein B2G71_04965 [Novosphingobium sp. PC22D]|nr:hypothetical protein B2G71_04965 [Novosphingobium sp. PC22D]